MHNLSLLGEEMLAVGGAAADGEPEPEQTTPAPTPTAADDDDAPPAADAPLPLGDDEFPDEALTVISRTGRAEIATDPMGVDFSDVYVMLEPEDEWTRAESQAELVAEMQTVLESSVPGVNFAFSQPIELRVNELIEGVRSDVALFLYGEDLSQLKEVGDGLVQTLSAIDGAQDVKVEKLAGLPMLDVRVDRQAISRLGIHGAIARRLVDRGGVDMLLGLFPY